VFYLTGYGGVDHSSHTLVAALILAAFVGLLGFWSARWVWGAFIGTFSHVLLDALVHSDVFLLKPLTLRNVLYMDWMEPLSHILLVLSGWWMLQATSSVMKRFAGNHMPAATQPKQPVATLSACERLLASLLLRQWRWHLARAAALLALLVLPILVIKG
jgi:hypothetical protein